jgi:hypothetical protein
VLQPLPKAPTPPPAQPPKTANATPAPTPAPAPKIAQPATSELQRVFIARSATHLRNANINDARAAVNEALRLGETPDALTALASTYDPLVLQDYPRLVSNADPARAIELYKKAADQGHAPAGEALAKLEAFQARRK